jgi:hypothetical protein
MYPMVTRVLTEGQVRVLEGGDTNLAAEAEFLTLGWAKPTLPSNETSLRVSELDRS